jgi:hypothetical protein
MASAAANHASCYFFVLRFLESQRYPYQHADEASLKIIELIDKMKQGEESFRE